MTHQIKHGSQLCVAVAFNAVVLLPGAPARGQAPDAAARFGTPEEALKALSEAVKSKDANALTRIFGPQLKELSSGDQVQDASELEGFSKRLERAAKFEAEGEDFMVLNVGAEAHPFPIPLVKEAGTWYFDTEEGKEEILNRRVGENELQAMRVCRGYVAAQREYFAQDRDGDGVLEYAQRLASTPGKQDGLYWETTGDQPPSPLGPLVAQARGEGYAKSENKTSDAPAPYFGYVFKLLTKQGADAPGGKFDYVINGNQVAGFGLLAFPVDWANSGVMTFLISANGKVLEKNLGEKTADLVKDIADFNPDSTWKPSEE